MYLLGGLIFIGTFILAFKAGTSGLINENILIFLGFLFVIFFILVKYSYY